MKPIVFLDLETTGLNPELDSILQIAFQCVDPESLELVGEPFVSDIALTELAAGRLYTNSYIRDMHRNSGLLARLESQTEEDKIKLSLTQVHQNAYDRLFDIPITFDVACLTLAGNSVHFDLGFLKKHMPRLAHVFSHHLLDISVLRMFEDSYGSGGLHPEKKHDALDDVMSSIEQFREYVKRRRSYKAVS